VVGLKPTYGRVSRHGVLDLGETLDHVGPLARYVEDAAIVLRVIAGQDPQDPTSLDAPVPGFDDLDTPIQGFRIGWDVRYASEQTDPELVSAIERALEVFVDLGASIVELSVPDTRDLGDIWFPICTFEALKAHAEYFPSRRAEYGNYFRDFLDMGAAVTAAQYAQAMTARSAFNEHYLATLSGVDALLCPAGGVTFPVTEDPYGGAETLAGLFAQVQMHFTIPADFAGTPALTLPCGVATDGRPLALQLVGSPLSEQTLVHLGRAYERATDWHDRHPPL
jgi:amidase